MNNNFAQMIADYLTGEQAKEERQFLFVWVLRVLVGLVLLLAAVKWAYAEPIARTESDGVVVTVYTEKCALPEVVNLPHRVTWVEKGKTTEGCAGANPLGVVVMYFADKTVVVHPGSAFVPVTGV